MTQESYVVILLRWKEQEYKGLGKETQPKNTQTLKKNPRPAPKILEIETMIEKKTKFRCSWQAPKSALILNGLQ
jgi:hypothetical protein